MFGYRRFLLGVIFLFLQACQSMNTSREQQAGGLHRMQAAAAYNTQLGLAYLQQGDRPRAKRKLLTALRLQSNSAPVNAAMAYYLEQTGDLEKAQVYYKKALNFAPHSGIQLNNYGTFLCRTGRYKEAEHYFLLAVKDMNYIHTAKAYENAGHCAMASRDYSKAKHYFMKTIEHDPRRRQVLSSLVNNK